MDEEENDLRVAWLFPSLSLGNYWHPVFCEFTKLYPQTVIYTGAWPGFSPGFEDSFRVEVVGRMKFVNVTQSKTGYGQGFIQVSPAIVGKLWRFRPDVIFTSGFCLWTILALLCKPLGGWQVIIVYDGSSPGVDYPNSPIRTLLRRLIVRVTNAFVTNSLAGKAYLLHLGSNPGKIFARPYQVPDRSALLNQVEQIAPDAWRLRPVFLFAGQIIPRKGLCQLLQACELLHQQGYRNYTLLVAGDGAQRQTLQDFCAAKNLEASVHWLGWVSYGQLGAYFRQADAFILPTLEDVWGMVVLEAMAFGKPVLCSERAGAAELVVHQHNGLLFDPDQPEAIAAAMAQLIDHPEQIVEMGRQSQQLMAEHTPAHAAQFLAKVTHAVTGIDQCA